MENNTKKYKLNILLVDDQPEILNTFSRAISRRVENVFTAPNGEQALDLYKNNIIDMVITDVEMPIMNGIDMIKEIRKIGGSIPIVLVTALRNLDVLTQAIELNVSSFLEKPVNLDEVYKKIDDVYKVKELENEIVAKHELLEQYKQIVDKGSIVSKTDPSGLITYANEEFCNISGYEIEELIGQSHNIVRHPDNDKNLYEYIWYTIKELKQQWSGEIKNKKKDGSPYWVKATIAPILDQNGDIIEYIALRTDVTEQETIKHYFEEQFEISNKQFHSAFRMSKAYENAINQSNTVSRTDTNGVITFVNEKFCETSGYKKEELIGKNHSITRHPDTPDSLFKDLWKTIKAGHIWKGLIHNLKKDGSEYCVDSTIVPIFNDENEIIEYMSVRHDVTEIFDLHKEIEDTQREVIYKMGEIGETRSKETGNHVKRVAEYSKLLAHLVGLDKDEADILFTASPMHDIGKVGIPDSILNKPGKLTDEEFAIMKDHALIGKRILQGSNRAVIKAARIVAYEHHEKWDGTGYPRKLKGEDIHIYGRITAIADVFDALGSDRCYKNAWDLDKILELFKNERAKHFDPKLVDLFFENLNQFLDIRDKYKD
jgi:PAS domain S-box-containing protein